MNFPEEERENGAPDGNEISREEKRAEFRTEINFPEEERENGAPGGNELSGEEKRTGFRTEINFPEEEIRRGNRAPERNKFSRGELVPAL